MSAPAHISERVGFFNDWILSNIVTIILCVVIAVPIQKIIYNAFFHPLASIPGPWLYGCSPIPWNIHRIRGDSAWKLVELHNKYGRIVRLQPDSVSTIGASASKDVAGHRVGKGGPMARGHGLVDDAALFGGKSLMFADIPTHARIRRRLSPAFSDKAVRDQEPLIRGHFDVMVDKVRQAEDRPVDMSELVAWLMFDIQGDLVFGSNVFRCVQDGRYHPWLTNVLGFMEMMIWLDAISSTVPGFGYLFPLLQKLKPKGVESDAERHVKQTKKMVDQRLAVNEAGHPDFMTFVLREDKDGELLTRGEIYATVQQLVVGGSDTVSSVITGALYYLMSNPEKLRKLKEEIRGTFGSASDITASKISGLEYLQAVLTETLRLYHPVALAFRLEVPEGGCMFEGHFLPKGTLVGVNSFPSGRHNRHFKDVEQFVPERWLGDERYAGDVREALNPFGAGPLACIGQALGHMETRLALSVLVWTFDMELAEGSTRWIENQQVYTLWKKPPMHVKFAPRRD